VYSVNTEYYRTTNGANTNISYKVNFGGQQNDTTAYPSTDDCTLAPGYTRCIGDKALKTELTSYLGAPQLPVDNAHLYPVFFAPGIETAGGGGGGGGTSAADYCGYHSEYGDAASPTVYTNEPYPDLGGCDTGQSPNGDRYADAAISTLSHEINEAITNPDTTGGWFDARNNENGDECLNNFGPPLGSTDPTNTATTGYNQAINGGFYYTQTEFSNTAFNAGTFQGCVQSEDQATLPVAPPTGQASPQARPRSSVARPTAATTTATRPTPDDVYVDASSYNVAADGTATTTLTVHVDDAHGPVAGDHINFTTAATTPTQGVCGTLANRQGTTNTDGDLTVTYTASHADISCDVVATEAATGQSGDAQIDQGTAGADGPAITVAYPTALTPDAPVTFTATTTNPGEAIPNAVAGIIITGDDTATTGVDAAQLHLSYTDAGGHEVSVALTGNTKNGGEITGSLPSETGATYPAGLTASTTVHLSIDPTAPTTAQTHHPLTAETDFDQVNPADGFTSTLDSTTADIPVLAPTTTASVTAVGATPNAGVGVAGVLLYAVIDPNTVNGTVALTDNGSPITDCTTRPVSAGFATCVTTFATAGIHTLTATYTGDPTHPGSTATTPITVTATPNFLQLALGYLIAYAHNLHLIGL